MSSTSRSIPLWRVARLVALTLLVANAVRVLVVGVFYIPSQSMMPGLIVGDYFLASKWDYGWSRHSLGVSALPLRGRVLGAPPRVGDVVIFSGVVDPHQTFIKRVMGLPGDTVEMRRGRFVLNGRELPQRRISEFVLPLGPNVTCLAIPGLIDLRALTADGRPGCRFLRMVERLPDGREHQVLDFAVAHSDTFGPAVVPPGTFFAMGDNRDDSLDSRFPVARGGLGMVPMDRLLGRARLVFFSSDGTGSLLRPWSWQPSLRLERTGPVR